MDRSFIKDAGDHPRARLAPQGGKKGGGVQQVFASARQNVTPIPLWPPLAAAPESVLQTAPDPVRTVAFVPGFGPERPPCCRRAIRHRLPPRALQCRAPAVVSCVLR